MEIKRNNCNQCGRCCKAEVCQIGMELFDTEVPPCPGLIFRDNKYWCGPVILADEIVENGSLILALGLGIGYGCDSIFSEEIICS